MATQRGQLSQNLSNDISNSGQTRQAVAAAVNCEKNYITRIIDERIKNPNDLILEKLSLHLKHPKDHYHNLLIKDKRIRLGYAPEPKSGSANSDELLEYVKQNWSKMTPDIQDAIISIAKDVASLKVNRPKKARKSRDTRS